MPNPVNNQSLLEGLTEPQAQAVKTTEGPLLVLAAAGSGKTRVITRRIAYLIGMGVPPWSIMALTFTNKAAGEMRERVMSLLGDDPRYSRGLTVTTFHALCARLLRRYANDAGIQQDYTIYDSGDQATLCKRVITDLQLSTSNWPPRSVLSAISQAKNNLQDATQFAMTAGDFYSKTIAKIYVAYEKALRQANAVDFDDLLVLTAKALKNSDTMRSECRRRWRYMLIDEYQDTNHAQFQIASLIAGDGSEHSVPGMENDGPGPNVCVVGDPDQAIYGWRGADISNILEFEDHYPKAKVIKLGENFRSTAPILAVADHLIRHNKRRKHKDLFTSKAGGESITVIHCRDEQHEASLVADWFKRLHENDVAWRDMAIFYRTNALSRVVEDAMRSAGIPYVIARGTAYYDREEVKSALAYLRLVANPADDVSLQRIINTPTRGIGGTTFDRIEEYARQLGEPLLSVMRRPDEVPELGRAIPAVQRFTQMIDGWTGGGTFMGAHVPTSLADLVSRVIKESGLEKMYKAQALASKSESDEERLDNLDELVSSAREFEMEYDAGADPGLGERDLGPLSDDLGEILGAITSGEGEAGAAPPLLAMLRGYLESVALVADADAVDPAQGAVTLMTLHAAKGLEFDSVAMVGLEEGLLPHSRARESEAELEEERRLCFVGITRAMRRLQMTSSRYRTMRGVPERTMPSRFLEELPSEFVRVSDQGDTFSGLSRAWGGNAPGGDMDDMDQTQQTAGWDNQSQVARARQIPTGTSASKAAAAYPVGAVVRHPQFGEGRVVGLSGGKDARATIEFKGVGVKTLVLEYARLTRLK